MLILAFTAFCNKTLSYSIAVFGFASMHVCLFTQHFIKYQQNTSEEKNQRFASTVFEIEITSYSHKTKTMIVDSYLVFDKTEII
jgi:hypothetical protein